MAMPAHESVLIDLCNYNIDQSLKHTSNCEMIIPSNQTVQSDFPVGSSDEVIPTVDYLTLFSSDPGEQEQALHHLGSACYEYGFFYLINGVPETLVEGALKAISDLYELTTVMERNNYTKRNPTDRMSWIQRANSGENRECFKLVSHPRYYCPTKPSNLRERIGEYQKSMREVELGLAAAISKTLGLEENYIEKALKLEEGFDVAAMNLYPASFQSKGAVGLPEHTDPGFIISLIQDVNGGLRILSHHGKWMNVYIPQNAVLIQLGDHLEILSNGKYKSHIHQVVVANNKVKRISMATLHGPSLEAMVCPATELLARSHAPPTYRGMTYKQSLELTGDDEIDVMSNITDIRIMAF